MSRYDQPDDEDDIANGDHINSFALFGHGEITDLEVSNLSRQGTNKNYKITMQVSTPVENEKHSSASDKSNNPIALV